MIWKLWAIAATVAACGLLGGAIWMHFRYRRRPKRDREKSMLLATMSHEIRTPLNAIIGFSELLQDDEISAIDRKDYIHSIHLSAETLLNLINNVLDYSKLESDMMRLNLHETDFPQLCTEMQTILGQLLEEKQLALEIDCPPALPLLRIDAERIRQVLFNLIGNAIKFTDHGSVAIQVVFVAMTPKHGELSFSVRDSGRGIPPAYQKKIFEPFVQQPGDTSIGSGLGLAITMQLIQKMRGRMTLESQVGKGSCFTVIIPEVEYIDAAVNTASMNEI